MSHGFLLTTARLCIRSWQPADRPAFERMAKDVEMMRYITGGVAMNDAQVQQFFWRQAGHLQTSGVCMGALVEEVTNEVVGVAGLQALDRDPSLDIGWWVWREVQGRGYATEAALALREFAHQRHPNWPLTASIDPDNQPSQAVARKLGLELTGLFPASDLGSWRPDNPVQVWRELGHDR